MSEKSADKIVAHGTLMFVATTAANACNFFFHAAMGRMLPASKYAEVAVLISLFFIFGVPAQAIQTVVTNYVATFKAKGEYGKVSYLFFNTMSKLSIYAGIAFVFFVAGSGYLAAFLKISSPIPVVVLGIVVLIGTLLPVGRGVLQGLQSFGYLGSNMIIDNFLRLFLGALLVFFGVGVSGAIGGQAISGLVALSLLFIPLRFLFSEKRDPEINSREIYKYFWPVAISLLCFTVLTQIDVVIVKHFFSPTQAGYYSGAAKAGTIVLFLPMAIATVMFPKVSEAHALDHDPRTILQKSLLIVGLLCGLVTTGYFLFPRLPLLLLYGSRLLAGAPIIGLFGVAMTFFALLNILLFYHLSTRRFTFLYILAGFTLLHVLLLWFFHGSLAQVVTIMAVDSFALFCINWLLVYPERLKILKARVEV